MGDEVAVLDKELERGRAPDHAGAGGVDPPRDPARRRGREADGGTRRSGGPRRTGGRNRRAQHPARPADPARRPDGIAGRRPRGQAARADPVPRRQSRATPRRSRPSPMARGDAPAGRRRRRVARVPQAGGAADAIGSLPPAVSRLLLGAQEDMRREIARADARRSGAEPDQHRPAGPDRGAPGRKATRRGRAGEVPSWSAMVQQTLEATKTFIFDVRPMVLDDLGLVPTLRRAARDRGRRTGVAVEFESLGQDRRLPMDLESGLFRILDEALAGYLEARAEHVSLRMDWSADQLDVAMAATREAVTASPTIAPEGTDGQGPAAGPRRDDGGASGRRAIRRRDGQARCDRRRCRQRPGARSRAAPRRSG